MKLKSLPVFFLDLQTTGAKPENASILEVAWSCPHSEIVAHLIEEQKERPVPKRIQMITGIKEADMKNARPIAEVMKELQAFIEDKTHAVIHFAQFEKPFLKDAFSLHEDIPFPIICTHEIAKRLYPNLPSRGIKGLAGLFGYSTSEFKRAHSHVTATKIIWEKLIEALALKNIHTLDELSTWMMETPKKLREKYEYPMPKEKRLALPDAPGVYRMLNSSGEVLYVGKATSLFSRVNSYFRGQKKRNAFKLEMLTQVYDVHVTECASPLEAALLETDEIKRLNPYYNISLKITGRSLVFFNRDFSSMNETRDDHHFIGPFSNIGVLLPMLKLIAYAKEADNGLLPDESTFFNPLDPALIKAGLDEFCQRHNVDLSFFSKMRRVMAQGLIWQYRLNKQQVLEEENLDDSEERENSELNAGDIADKIERHVRRVGRAYARVRRLEPLMNCRILYNEKEGPEYCLKLIQGQAGGRIEDNPWVTSPIQTYDRLTVLLTELHRVKKQGGRFKIIEEKYREDFGPNQ